MGFKLTTLALLALLFCSVRAFPLLNVTDTFVEREIEVFPEENPDDIVDLDALDTTSRFVQAEVSKYFAASYRTGYARVTSAGITVQRGTSGYLTFRIRAVGIDAKTLSQRDDAFSQYIAKFLGQQWLKEYQTLKKQFSGSLDLPIFHFLGFDLNKKFSEQTAQAKSRIDVLSAQHYNELTAIAKKTLSDYTETKTVITGKLRAEGISLRPTTVFAFLKHSRIQFTESDSTNVYTTLGKDLVAASPSGQSVPSDDKYIEII